MKYIFLLMAISISLFSGYAQPSKNFPQKTLNVLVFHKTEGWHHQSISSGIKMFNELALQEGWSLTTTENSNLFTMDFLVNFDVVVFLNPTGNILNPNQQKAFETFMKTGKGFVGIHAASDCEYEWDWFGKLCGAYFLTHPPAQEGKVIIEDHNHPAMKVFEGMDSYTTFDEWYSFKENPRENVHVLARLDESSIKKSKNDDWKMGDHPLIWWQEFDDIRSFYSVLGHTNESFQNQKVRDHYSAAVNWAGRKD
ncbi:ThuA domain-containing protein [uncultured Sunxiuqinia sp.]|uniref:ThuA domain-containing protein n=1 Tax=uncultured Sunxiuqinia sp. TaxID=1573825 RepID=UPI002AA86E4E|nr:ThuA domain-containing protein [uncultured Sunxiuqinia sp.]